jgi:peptidoglycan/xylan/chitin deacetylase (PgdA/CDA1 family)/glycosyltransferase involved in cell wall biosynthesis
MSTSGVAVVITCYDLGRTLPEAVESVLGQTASAEEIVVVDDGSRDPLTQHVIGRLEQEVGEVEVIRSDHGGAAHARNVGVESTQAPFIVLLDADDLFESTYLEQASELLRSRPDLGFVSCALQAFGRLSYRWKPPPFTLVDAIGRCACGHISTVFRRELWQQVGKFDEAMPTDDDTDYWLRAIEHGFRGAILDEALVRYRIRDNSWYRRAVIGGDYRRAKEMLLDKHLDGVEAHGEDVFAALLDFERELARHTRWLGDEWTRLADVETGVEAEVSSAAAALAEMGLAPFNWGELASGNGGSEVGVTPIEQHYLAEALNALDGELPSRRRLTIRPGDDWPDVSRPRYDLVLVAAALEYARDPADAITRCRQALRPEGQLVVLASPMVLGKRRWGFSEAALRSLLTRLFPPETVTVRSVGNLLSSLASAAGWGPTALRPFELNDLDSQHATLVVASAQAPHSKSPRTRRQRDRVPMRLSPSTPVRRRGMILLYHRIAALSPDAHNLCTDPEAFAGHMALIAERYHPVGLLDLVSQAKEGELRPGTVAVTFDDGYLDNLEIASPILVELGIPATFFINAVSEDVLPEGWWDTTERILLGNEKLPPTLSVTAGDLHLELSTEDAKGRRDALSSLHDHLLYADATTARAIVDQLVEWNGLELGTRSTHRVMTADELLELSRHPGHELGAHGAHHVALPAQPPEVQEEELGGCKDALEHLLGAPVHAVAYPYGECDFATTQIAEEVGFRIGCGIEPDPVGFDCDPLRLPRLEPRGEDAEGLRFSLDRALTDPA